MRSRNQVRIPMPRVVKKPNTKGHPYPVLIAWQTQELMHCIVFYLILSDTAAGQYGRLPDGLQQLERKLVAEGMRQRDWDDVWKLIPKYMPIMQAAVFQNGLISICSQWDWFVRNIRDFVLFAREHIELPILSKKQERGLTRIDRLSILQQLELLEASCAVRLSITPENRALLKEMTLVRNVGLHNRWEVDEKYSAHTSTGPWEVGEVRVFDQTELHPWHVAFLKATSEVARGIARVCKDAPDYG